MDFIDVKCFSTNVLDLKSFIMDSGYLKHSPDHEYPAIKLDMTGFLEELSGDYICEKDEVSSVAVEENSEIMNCKIESSAQLESIIPMFECTETAISIQVIVYCLYMIECSITTNTIESPASFR